MKNLSEKHKLFATILRQIANRLDFLDSHKEVHIFIHIEDEVGLNASVMESSKVLTGLINVTLSTLYDISDDLDSFEENVYIYKLLEKKDHELKMFSNSHAPENNH